MSTICDRVDDQLSDFRDGELNRLRRWWIGSHLRRCRRCTAAAEDLGRVDAGIHAALLAAEPPDYLTAAVMRRLPAMPPARRRRWAGARWFLGAGCLVLQTVSLWGAYRAGTGELRLRAPHLARPSVGMPRPAPALAAPAAAPRARRAGPLISAAR